MPKRVSLGRLSRRSLAKGKCKIETAISELSLATVCSSAEFSDFVEDPGQEDSSSPVSSFASDLPYLAKQRSCVSCCPSCCYPLLEVSNESNAVSGNVAKALGSASPSLLDQWSSLDSVKDCSSQTQELVPQHVLLEYVKGLQDANKARDADTAERLLQELGDCLNSLSAASTVVSAGGARTVASTLKLFRFYSLQKPFKDTMKHSRLGISKNLANVGAAGSEVIEEMKPSCAPDSWVGSTYKQSVKCSNPINTSMFLSNTSVVPMSGNVVAEVGRKRQRTAEDLDEDDLSGDEENSEATNCELCVSADAFGAFPSSDGDLLETTDKVQGSTLDACYVEASREGFLEKVKEGGIGQDDACPVGRFDGRCIVTSEHSARVISDTSNSVATAEDKCRDSLEIADEDNLVAGQNLGDLFVDESVIPRNDGYKASVEKMKTSLSSGSFTTDVFDSSTATSNRQRQEQKVNSNGRVNGTSQADSCCVGESRENREFQKHCKQNEQQYGAEENVLARSHVEERVIEKISRKHWTGQKMINTDEETNEKCNVLSLTKEAGLADVLCAGCFVLERLLSVVLQGKGCLKNQSSTRAGNGRQGKSLRAEMYVALTEAFVEILHPLRDIVSMLTWCLDCLANILPPCTSETCMGYSSVQNAVASCLAGKDPWLKPLTQGEDCKVQTTLKCGIQSVPKDQEVAASKSALMSFPGAGTGKSQNCAVSLGNQLRNEMGTESTASPISALAAVAYSATVPMLAEKAVKGILQVIHPGNIDVEPTISAALRALSAHLSSATAKAVCDDAFAFIIAAMKEFVSNAEIQIEGLVAIGSLTRALNSTTGHTAWVAVTLSMGHHRTNLVVQRAGCRTLQSLCAKTAIGHSEWSNGKRPLKASKDSDREGGVRALVSAMLAFPQDVRIQWYACSTIWILVHSAGVKSILTMVNDGAVMAVVGAMVVCRTNEVMQQEGCNVLGTMANTFSESDFKCDVASAAGSVVDASTIKVSCRCDTTENCKTIPEDKQKDGVQDDKKKGLATVNDWWAALWAVVEAMKAFRSSESVQSYGTYALGCMLKIFSEAGHSGTSVDLLPTPWLLIDAGNREMPVDSTEMQTGKQSMPALEMMAKDAFPVLVGTEVIFAKDVLDGIGKLHTVVEVTMAAMSEFPMTETVQIWGCAVLQQAFPAYIQLAHHMLQFSDNSEFGISTIDNLTDSTRGSLTSQVSSSKTDQKPLPFMPVSSASSSALANANIFLKGSYDEQPVEASLTDGYESSVASILKCNSEMPSAAIVGETVDGNENIISSECTKRESFQLTCFMNSQNIHIPSLANQGEEVKAFMAQEAMDSGVLQCHAFVDLVLSQAISALSLISKFSVSDFNDTPTKESKSNVTSSQPCRASSRLFGNKFVSGKLQSACGSTKPVVSVRQSWFAFLVVLGDMFGHLLKNTESVEGGGSGAKSVINSDQQQRQEASCDKSEMPSQQCDPNSNFISKDHEVHQQLRWDAMMLSRKKSCVSVSLSVKTAITAVTSVLSKIEDADTVIWALHAVSSLYTAWENICICNSGATNRQELKPNIWGDDDVGVKQLVDLVSYWTEENRLDVTCSALQALNNACNCAATINEIEDVFGIQPCGMQAVLCALQKALGPSVTIQQRRKVIQLSCHVLSAVCGCSIRSQVSFATGGGADLVLAALVRYGEDNQTFTSGLLALGIDSQLQPYFSELLNAAVSRNMTAGGGKFSKRKKNGSLMGNGVVGLNHVFKESIGVASPLSSKSLKGSDIMMNGNESAQYRKEKWTSQLKSILFDGKVQMGAFQTLLIASPGCGGPLFAVELLKSLNEEPQIGVSAVEAQAHVCTVISYMADTDSKWRQELINARAIEAVLATMGFVYSWRNEKVFSFHLIGEGIDNCLEPNLEIEKMPLQTISSERDKQVSSGVSMINGERDSYDATIQCAACWALASLVKDHRGCFSSEWILLIQAVAVALHRYGGLAHPQNYGTAMVSSHPEVCMPARLVLARLGVTRVGNLALSHEASGTGDIACLKVLASKGVDLWTPDDSGQTALWYAEKFGHTHVLQYLKSHAHLQGKKRCRGKSTSKCKQSNRKEAECGHLNSCAVDLQGSDSQIDETVMLQNEHISAATSCKTGVFTEHLKHSPSFTDLQNADMITGKSEDGNQISSPSVYGDSLCDEKHRKGGVESMVQTDAMNNGISFLEKCNKLKKNKKVQVEQIDGRSMMEKCSLNVEEASTIEEDTPLQSDMDAVQLNLMLHEALGSGNVQKLEDAVKSCTVSTCKADKDLLKKVKAALQKRLRRIEKCGALDSELRSAMKEGDRSQLNMSISAIEAVPRFATALQEILNAARQRLKDIEMGEKMMDLEAQIVSECSNETDESSSAAKDNFALGIDMITASVPMQVEDTDFRINQDCNPAIGSDHNRWTEISTGIKQKQCFQVADNQRAVNKVVQKRNEPGEVKGGSMNGTMPKKVQNIQRTVQKHSPVLSRDSEGAFQWMPVSQSLPIVTESCYSAAQSISATLPRTSWIARSTGQNCQSVIKPPHAKNPEPNQSMQHLPITSQLFPASSGAPLGYGCNVQESDSHAGNTYFDNLRTFEGSLADASSELISASQMSHAYAYFDHVKQEPETNVFVGPENIPFASLVFESRASNGLPSLLCNSTTENISSGCSVGRAVELPPLPSDSFLHYWNAPHMHSQAHSFLFPAQQRSFRNLCTVTDRHSYSKFKFDKGPASSGCFSPGTDCSWLCCDNWVQNDHENISIGSCSVSTAIPSPEEHFTGAASDTLAELLQRVILSDALVSETCSICQNTTKDATLIPCGHSMCKGCAGKVQMISCHCPICSHFISAVHTLY